MMALQKSDTVETHRKGSSPTTEVAPLIESSLEEQQQAVVRASFQKTVYKELGTPFRYRSVAVLLIHWIRYLDEHLKCREELDDLQSLFNDRFHFKCEILTLDDKSNPQLQLNDEVSRFVRSNNGDCRTHLVILYYTGHGDDRKEDGLHIRGHVLHLHDRRGNTGCPFEAKARWKPVKHLLAGADADVLTILDSCNAGSAVKGSREDSKLYEVLAAAGSKGTTPSPGPTSFTRAMIKSLEHHLETSPMMPITTFELNQAIMERRGTHGSQLFSLPNPGNRFVRLAPLILNRPQRALMVPPSLSVSLRFDFVNTTALSPEQAQRLAMALSRAVIEDARLEPAAIDWVGTSSAAGRSSPADAERLENIVIRMQRIWKVWRALRNARQCNGRKHSREEESGIANGPRKRRRRVEE